jgi:hypothetical protein
MFVPTAMLDDDRRKAVTMVGYLAHSETLKHRPCRSHAVNVTMPRYGNRRIELKPGKPTIEGGAAENPLPTLQAVKDAIAAGELDTLLMAAKKERGRPKRKAAA